MGWIKNRIEAEHRKHGSMPEGLEKYNLDWAKLAEQKILMQIKEDLKDLKIKIVENDIFTADEIFRVIDETFANCVEGEEK